MFREELTREMLALPVADRVELAQALWQSIGDAEEDEVVNEEQQTLRLARERERELSSGEVSGLTHQEVMEAARRALR